MPGVLLDTQTVSSPFDRRHLHHHHHYPFHGSPPLSTASSCSIAITPTSSASAQEDPSPDSPPPPLRFGDLPPNSFTPSPPPGFMLHPLGIPNCYSPSMQFCSPPDLSHSPRLGHLDVREEVGQKVFSRTLSKLGGSGVVGLNGSRATEDGECGALVASFEASSGCASEEIHIPDAVMAAAGAGNYGTSATGACMVGSPVFPDAITALQKFLPSNNEEDDELWPMDSWPAMDVYSCDDFRMYEFKVRRCMRGRSHDWTECPFAHPGEKARRRDPRKFHYSGTACPDFRKGSCKRGETCEYAHGVFECWLHPARYRTQPCKDGRSCRRRVCFFAHTAEQLRVLPGGGCPAAGSPPASLASSPGSSARSSVLKAALSGGAYDGSPLRQALAGSLDGTLALELLYEQGFCKTAPHSGAAGLCCYSAATPSPTSTLFGHHSLSPPSPSSSASSSPPLSPSSSPSSAWPRSSGALPSPSAHRRHLERLHSLPTVSIPGFDDRNLVHLNLSPDVHSPRSMNELISTLQQLQLKGRPVEPCRMASFPWSFPQYSSLSGPGTPRSRYAYQDDHRDTNEAEAEAEAEPVVQRVDSGRDSRVKLSAKSTNENPVENDAPDFDWVNELVK